MIILFLTSGPHVPSTRFRVLQYIPHLQSLGHACRVAHSFPPKYRGLPLIGTRASEYPRRAFRLWDLFRAWISNYDIVFVERELFTTDFVVIERAFRKIARKMVLDIDDAIFLGSPHKFPELVGMCDCVIVGNQRLADRVSPLNSRTVLIPTVVDLERYQPVPREARPQHPLVIGWTGLSSNLEYLRVVESPLRSLGERHSLKLRIIAEDDHALRTFDFGKVAVEFVPWHESTEISDLQEIDIGIMPLPDNDWTRYKCGFKLIQYMALAIPSVASPVGVNCDIVRHGENGYLADLASEWESGLERLILSPALQKQIGQAGRKTIEAGYSLQSALPQFLGTLEGLCADPS